MSSFNSIGAERGLPVDLKFNDFFKGNEVKNFANGLLRKLDNSDSDKTFENYKEDFKSLGIKNIGELNLSLNNEDFKKTTSQLTQLTNLEVSILEKDPRTAFIYSRILGRFSEDPNGDYSSNVLNSFHNIVKLSGPDNLGLQINTFKSLISVSDLDNIRDDVLGKFEEIFVTLATKDYNNEGDKKDKNFLSIKDIALGFYEKGISYHFSMAFMTGRNLNVNNESLVKFISAPYRNQSNRGEMIAVYSYYKGRGEKNSINNMTEEQLKTFLSRSDNPVIIQLIIGDNKENFNNLISNKEFKLDLNNRFNKLPVLDWLDEAGKEKLLNLIK